MNAHSGGSSDVRNAHPHPAELITTSDLQADDVVLLLPLLAAALVGVPG